MQEIDESSAKVGNPHTSTAVLIVMCIFGIIGLGAIILETILGLGEIAGK
jgi:hypothetical protein